MFHNVSTFSGGIYKAKKDAELKAERDRNPDDYWFHAIYSEGVATPKTLKQLSQGCLIELRVQLKA